MLSHFLRSTFGCSDSTNYNGFKKRLKSYFEMYRSNIVVSTVKNDSKGLTMFKTDQHIAIISLNPKNTDTFQMCTRCMQLFTTSFRRFWIRPFHYTTLYGYRSGARGSKVEVRVTNPAFSFSCPMNNCITVMVYCGKLSTILCKYESLETENVFTSALSSSLSRLEICRVFSSFFQECGWTELNPVPF